MEVIKGKTCLQTWRNRTNADVVYDIPVLHISWQHSQYCFSHWACLFLSLDWTFMGDVEPTCQTAFSIAIVKIPYEGISTESMEHIPSLLTGENLCKVNPQRRISRLTFPSDLQSMLMSFSSLFLFCSSFMFWVTHWLVSSFSRQVFPLKALWYIQCTVSAQQQTVDKISN